MAEQFVEHVEAAGYHDVAERWYERLCGIWSELANPLEGQASTSFSSVATGNVRAHAAVITTNHGVLIMKIGKGPMLATMADEKFWQAYELFGADTIREVSALLPTRTHLDFVTC